MRTSRTPRLREIREGKRLSQRKLSRAAGVPRSRIQALEAGGAAFGTTICGLAEALGVDSTDLTAAA